MTEVKINAKEVSHAISELQVQLGNQEVAAENIKSIMETLNVLPDDITPKEVKEEYELYTMLDYDTEADKWIMTQEIEQEIVGKEKTFKNYDDLPFRYLGWTWMTGDDYHRPYTEDYYKDLEQLDKLAKLLTDGALVAAKVLLFVNERGGRTRKSDVTDTDNGDVVDGSADDVTALQLQKNFDFQMVADREGKLQKTLAQAFLMNESVTRDAERVTAQEISYMARELESSSLAGIYSKLALQWSKWNVHQIMMELGIKFESIEVEILTGLDALGRSQEAQKLDNLLQRAEALGLRDYFDESELLNRYSSFEGVNTVNLVKSPKEVEQLRSQRQQQAQQAAMMEGMAQGAGTGAANVVSESLAPPQE